jgi:hypothetical protein
MKHVMKTKSTFFVLIIAFIMASCGKSSTTSTEAQTPAKAANENLKTVLTGYFELKDALVGDDAAKAKVAAAALATSTGTYANALNESLNLIASTDDIEAQRTAFETLSINLYDAAKNGGAGITIYKQYCPMAFDDKGAFWLSSEKQVLNPYFGASMLRCGSVKETIN